MKRIGILRGGTTENYDNSLRRGGEVFSYFVDNAIDKYKPIDILVDREGVWHIGGLPVMPADLVHKVDVVWNMGDAEHTATLDNFSIPHISKSNFSHSLENNRDMLREHMKQMGANGISMPRSIILSAYQEDLDGPRARYAIKKAKEVHEKFGAPWIVKLASLSRSGSFIPNKNMTIHLAKTFGELAQSIEDGVNQGDSILVEEFIVGKPSAVHSVGNFRNEEVYVFPPQNFNTEEKEKIINIAKELYKHSGATHYLKADFIFNANRGLILTDVYFLPDIQKDSHFDQACEYVGISMNQMIEHLLSQAT